MRIGLRLMTSGRSRVGTLGLTMTPFGLAMLAKLLMQHLSFLPRVLVARGGSDDCGCKAEKSEDADHGGVGFLERARIVSSVLRSAIGNLIPARLMD